MKSRRQPRPIPVEERLPAVGARVVVVTKTFRCLGHRDQKGVWRYDADNKEIKNVVGWNEFNERNW